ncbi:MAG: aromatic amino acid ammonia-lyase, partial [Bacteroidales bacterium]|nr:aromatic amino acid ammonia-lyase [Bacteroidales bacterium]
AIHIDVVNLLEYFINHNIIPFVPEHGGVGASGDLVQLSHIALALLGEGDVYYKGELQPAKKVFKELGLEPLKCHLREGLGLINGTSVMTGIGVINVIRARNLVNWSVIASSLINEIVKSFDDHISFELNSTKQHAGHQIIAKAMREFVEGSRLIKRRQDNSYKIKNGNKNVFEEKVQEYYSLRCVPQILGPVYETIENADRILTEEVNSVNDNPIVDAETKQVYHGGNFHGDYVSFEMDKLKIAVTKLSILAERQINFLMNSKLNEILPPFINLGVLGLNLGLQGTQFTATSTVAENQTLSNPVYIHSIPNNGDNQDVVSMGTNAALMSRKVIDNTFQVLAVEFLSLAYAVKYLGFEEQLSSNARHYFNEIKRIVTITGEDTVKYTDLKNIKEYLQNNRPNVVGKV